MKTVKKGASVENMADAGVARRSVSGNVINVKTRSVSSPAMPVRLLSRRGVDALQRLRTAPVGHKGDERGDCVDALVGTLAVSHVDREAEWSASALASVCDLLAEQGRLAVCLCELYRKEIEATPRCDVLFREDSIATKLFGAVMRSSASRKYLPRALGPVLREIADLPADFDLSKETEKLKELTTAVLANLEARITRMHPACCAVFKELQVMTERKFPEFVSSLPASLFFLRFVSPAVSQPREILPKKSVSTKALGARVKNYITLAKTLQTLSNPDSECTSFGAEDVCSLRQRIAVLWAKLCTVTTADVGEAEGSADAVSYYVPAYLAPKKAKVLRQNVAPWKYGGLAGEAQCSEASRGDALLHPLEWSPHVLASTLTCEGVSVDVVQLLKDTGMDGLAFATFTAPHYRKIGVQLREQHAELRQVFRRVVYERAELVAESPLAVVDAMSQRTEAEAEAEAGAEAEASSVSEPFRDVRWEQVDEWFAMPVVDVVRALPRVSDALGEALVRWKVRSELKVHHVLCSTYDTLLRWLAGAGADGAASTTALRLRHALMDVHLCLLWAASTTGGAGIDDEASDVEQWLQSLQYEDEEQSRSDATTAGDVGDNADLEALGRVEEEVFMTDILGSWRRRWIVIEDTTMRVFSSPAHRVANKKPMLTRKLEDWTYVPSDASDIKFTLCHRRKRSMHMKVSVPAVRARLAPIFSGITLIPNVCIKPAVLKSPTVVSDDRGIITDCNWQFLDLFGYERDEVMGRNVKILMPDEVAAVHDSYIKRYRRTATRQLISRPRRVIAQKKDDTMFPIVVALGEFYQDKKRYFVGNFKPDTWLGDNPVAEFEDDSGSDGSEIDWSDGDE